MPFVNYVKEHNAFIEYAADNGLRPNEILVWESLFHIMNQRANGNYWPDGFIRVKNDRLLTYAPIGFDSLSRARNALAQRGLISYKPGKKNADIPMYELHYLTAVSNPQPQGDIVDNPVDNSFYTGFYPQFADNMGYNMGGNMGDISINNTDIETVPQRKPQEIHTQDGNYGEYSTSRARAQGYIGTDGEMHPSRYDSAWATSKRARGAVAQRLIDGFPGDPLPYDEHARLMKEMENGVAPEAIEDIAKSCEQRKTIFSEIRAYAMKYGFTEEARIMRECLYAMNGNQAAAQAMYRMRMHDKEAD